MEVARSEGGLGLFVRALVGLDREAAKRVFYTFSAGKALAANQLEFVNLIINHLTSRGSMDPGQLYRLLFIDQHPAGFDGIFDDPSVHQLLTVLTSIKQNATA